MLPGDLVEIYQPLPPSGEKKLEATVYLEALELEYCLHETQKEMKVLQKVLIGCLQYMRSFGLRTRRLMVGYFEMQIREPVTLIGCSCESVSTVMGHLVPKRLIKSQLSKEQLLNFC
jgi:CRISPR/Cas system-associated endonuclease Cas3-HD